MSAWQPIETAPKDGTEILLYAGVPERGQDRNYRTVWRSVVAYWLKETNRVLTESEIPELFRWVDRDDGHWQMTSGYGVFWEAPTHWMLLPEPPK